jgi:DNA helicase-2/ATP-dependent DNA helicase PcrA
MQDLLADLTEPQRDAVTHVDGPLLILAAAGSGKTRVITRRVAHLIQSGVRPSNILAITFTNKAAGEMRQRVEQLLPGNRVLICTFHSLGVRVLRQYADRLGIDKNFTIYDVDDRNKLVKEAIAHLGMDDVSFTPERLAGAISKAKNQLTSPGQYEQGARDFFSQTAAKVYAKYEKLLRAANGMDFDDLLYLPAMALRMNEEFRRDLDTRFKYILVDEYQDTNKAQYEIARRMSYDHPNLCVVGDPDQCLHPSTPIATERGTIPISEIRDGDRVLTAIGWGRTGYRPVEKVMASHSRGTVVRIRVAGGREIVATTNHMCFSKIVATPNQHFVYLMFKRGMGFRIGTTRGVRTSKDGKMMSGLQVRTNQEVADAIWIIKTCATSSEARYFEQLLSVQYGIPTFVFFVRGRSMDIDQTMIDRLYRTVDTERAAGRLMSDFHLDRRYPHHRPWAVVRGGLARRQIHFTVFGDARTKTDGRCHEHRVQMNTSGEELRDKAKAAALLVRQGNKGTWRIETSRKDYDDAQSLVQQIAALDHFEIVSHARLSTESSFSFTPASHLQPGMITAVLVDGQIEDREIESVAFEEYDGPVYDLSIPETRNFVANGVVVHNSIYKWRGSDIRNILDFERDFPQAKVIALETNFRSTPNILNAAGRLIEHNVKRKKKALATLNPAGEPVRILTFDTGLDEAEGVVLEIKRLVKAGTFKYRDCAIFLRINALSRSLESAFVKHGVPFQIVKGLAFYERKENKDILAYLRLLANPSDTVSFLRAVAEPARGVGKTSLERLNAYAAEREISLFQAAGQVGQIADIRGKAATGLKDFHRLITELRSQFELPPPDLINLVLDKSGYRQMLKQSKDDDDAERLANIEEMITAAQQFAAADPERTLTDFLEQVALTSDVDGYDESSDRVSVMTFHAAKGLEFPCVFLMAVEQGLLPHERSLQNDEELEEERRLCFVGMTRAMKQLYLTHGRTREFRGQILYAIPSMFFDELPADVVRDDRTPKRFFASVSGQLYPTPPREYATSLPPKPVAPPPMPPPAVTATGTFANPADYHVGQIVQHEQYGIGRISDVAGFGTLRKVKIHFPAAGEKTFVADKVKLKAVPKK